jgi:hypothetical protein
VDPVAQELDQSFGGNLRQVPRGKRGG